MTQVRTTVTAALALAVLLASCTGGRITDPSHVDNNAPGDPADEKERPKTLQADYGLHTEDKIVYMGALNDETGPGAAIGKPYANGKRILAAWINSGKSDLLPKGWKLELVERDHEGDPKRAILAYKETKDKVLFFGTGFGDSATLALLKMLKDDDVILYPASMHSDTATNEYTPPPGPSYRVEAMRAMNWVAKERSEAATPKAGIIYTEGRYGKDGLEGWREAARATGVAVVSEQKVGEQTQDFSAAVGALKKAGADHVLLTTLPGATGAILTAGAQQDYRPIWMGNTLSWNDTLFDSSSVPAAALGNFRWVTGFPYWGEEVPGMDRFLAAYEAHGRELGPANCYTLFSFVQGMLAVEATRIALERNDATRSGYRQALSKVSHFDAGGMMPPMDFSEVPFRAGNQTRVLKPDLANRTWSVVGGFEAPIGLPAPAEGEAAPEEGEAAPAEG